MTLVWAFPLSRDASPTASPAASGRGITRKWGGEGGVKAAAGRLREEAEGGVGDAAAVAVAAAVAAIAAAATVTSPGV